MESCVGFKFPEGSVAASSIIRFQIVIKVSYAQKGYAMKRTTTTKKHATLSSALRKTVSVFASCALAVSMLGIPAFADEGEEPETPEVPAEELDTLVDTPAEENTDTSQNE